jgi:hypothetical protein
MPRGYRNIVVAAVGLLTLAASPRQSAEREQARSQVAIAKSLATIANSSVESVKPVPPSERDQPCRKGEQRRESELCAYWQAADEAAEASKWAARSFWAALGGVVGLLFTLWFNLEAWRGAKSGNINTTKALREAARSADAMQQVATSLGDQAKLLVETTNINREILSRQKTISELQLRAYLSVVIGGGVYQERDKNLRFEARPILLNNGNTPAQKISHKIRAAILPVPLPADYVLDRPEDTDSESLLPANQNRVMSAVVADFVEDDLVPKIMRGEDFALYAWGTVTYEDAFQLPRIVEFCHHIIWLVDNDGKPTNVLGYYTPGRNKLT